MKNTKENKANDLLVRRRPRLGKFIILAVVLHVFFAAGYYFFHEPEPPEEKKFPKPVMKDETASQDQIKLRHSNSPQSALSVNAQNRPMSPARTATLALDNQVDPPLPRRPESSAMAPRLPNLTVPESSRILKRTAPLQEFGKMEQAKAERPADPEDLHLAQLIEKMPTIPAIRIPDALPKPPGVVRDPPQLIRPAAVVPPVKTRHGQMEAGPGSDATDRANSGQPKPAGRMDLQLASFSKPRLSEPTVRRPSSRPKVRYVVATRSFYKFKKTTNDSMQVSAGSAPPGVQIPAGHQGMRPVSVAEMQPSSMAAPRPAGKPNEHFAAVWQPARRGIKTISSVSGQGQPFASSGVRRRPQPTLAVLKLTEKPPAPTTVAHQPPVRFKKIALGEPKLYSGKFTGDSERLINRRSKSENLRIAGIRAADVSLKPKMTHAPLKVPQLTLRDHIAELISHLIQPARRMFTEKKIVILSNNLTYQDMGIESEMTKFLSGLVTDEIDNQEYADSLSPGDMSGTPAVRLEGEMWDHPDEIKLQIRIMDPITGRKIAVSNTGIGRKLLPDGVDIRPPESESLDIIQKAVALSKRYFPGGGDFRLGVWPDKGMDAVYRDGENLLVYIVSEKNAYLLVDYYQIDGQVVHLLPTPEQLEFGKNSEPNNYVAGGKPISIGDYGYYFVVEPPFGEEMLMVIATQKRLDVPSEDMKEDAALYLSRLATSLQSQKTKGEMAASQIIILTQARKPESHQ